MLEFLEPIWTVRDCPRTVWATSGIIYAINYVVMCMRPKMAMEFGFTKWNRCLVSGCEQYPEGFTIHMNSVLKIFL